MRQPTQPSQSSSAFQPLANTLSHTGIRRFSAIEFFAVLVLWILSASFLFQLRYGDLIEAVLATFVLVSAVLAVGGRRRTLAIAIVLGSPVFVCKWLNHWWPAMMPRQVYTAGLIVFLAFIVGHHLHFVLRARQVNLQVLCAGISIYLLLGILWAGAYMLVGEINPGAFSFTVATDAHRSMVAFQALYFSLCTMGGFAYGDIIPISNAAKTLAMAEATASIFYVTILIARLVSLYSSKDQCEKAQG